MTFCIFDIEQGLSRFHPGYRDSVFSIIGYDLTAGLTAVIEDKKESDTWPFDVAIST